MTCSKHAVLDLQTENWEPLGTTGIHCKPLENNWEPGPRLELPLSTSSYTAKKTPQLRPQLSFVTSSTSDENLGTPGLRSLKASTKEMTSALRETKTPRSRDARNRSTKREHPGHPPGKKPAARLVLYAGYLERFFTASLPIPCVPPYGAHGRTSLTDQDGPLNPGAHQRAGRPSRGPGRLDERFSFQ